MFDLPIPFVLTTNFDFLT